MLLILPFEEAIYRKADVPAVFVGNPMVDTVPEALSAPERGTPKRYDMPQARQRQSPDVGGIPYVGLFAGSRPNVLKRHIPILLEAAKLIENETRAHFAFFASKNTAEHFYSLPYPVVIEDDYRERQKLTIAITTSGTVSLENALLGIPMVVMYRLSGFNYAVAKLLVSIPHIAMANILTNKELVPELIQNRANAKDIASASLRFLKDDSYYFAVRKELLAIREMLGAPGIYERTAKIILGKT